MFEFIRRIVLASPLLRDEAQVTQFKITFAAFNATIQAIASDAGQCRWQQSRQSVVLMSCGITPPRDRVGYGTR